MNRVKDQVADEKLNANDVGRQFLAQYYNAMALNIDDVARNLYSDSSIVKRFGNAPVSGLENIRTELAQHHMNNKFKVRIMNTICLNSLENSIIMQVAGEYIQEENDPRAFIQNVVLASQGPRKYYIHSDMIEWLDELYPNVEIKKIETHKQPQFNGHSTPNKPEQPIETFNNKPEPPHPHVHQQPESNVVHQNGQLNAQPSLVQPLTTVQQSRPAEVSPPKERSLTPNDVDKFAQLNTQTSVQSFSNANSKEREPSTVNTQQNSKPADANPVAATPQDTGPPTWAKLVSGKIKSNGLPPPTQPPVDPSAQQMNINYSGKFNKDSAHGNHQTYGNKDGNYNRDRSGNFNKDTQNYRSRRPVGPPHDRPQYRRDYDNNQSQGGGYKPFNGNNNGERSFVRKNLNGAGGNNGGAPPRRDFNVGRRNAPRQRIEPTNDNQ
ncbi:Ras GTPase-activating protein-binding protein 2 [Aphelenchoides besseyi]|nr:Ras GTPase-activating protein-binding protein 2 [Aphelenchoides besseyi]KAI6202528.1 Ras GTPase-activating protein-binding protein 2 [Aphelenchoides besseyi]